MLWLLLACSKDFEGRACEDQDDDGFCAEDDCDDLDAAVNPGQPEDWYDLVDQDCDGNDQDQDGDGYGLDQDCDDTDPDINPQAEEIWADGVDQDCDGVDDDVDGDGFGLAEDCDDSDPAIHPFAQEVWYDGVDQNCDGNDDDQDYDGSPVGEDCDDTNASRTPGAEEIWYDGIDQDCDDNDDDQDGDGFRLALDCDDTDPDANPGAAETWYDGADSDCDGADDYDADRDGWQAEAWGEDCDDTDPTVSPDGTETLADATDSDCDGAVDQAAFDDLNVAGSTGLVGPRVGEHDDGVLISVFAEDRAASGDTGAYWAFLDDAAPWDGVTAIDGWTLSGSYTLGAAYDMAAEGDFIVEGVYLGSGNTGYAIAFATDTASGDLESFGVSATGLGAFDDIHVGVAAETFELAFCEDSDDFLIVMRGSGDDFIDGDALWAYNADLGGQACSVRPGDNTYSLSDTGSGTTRTYSYAGSTSLSGTSTSSGTFRDRDVDTESGVVAQATAKAGSIELKRNSASTTFAVSAQVVRVDVDGNDLYMAYVDASGDAWLVYGTTTGGFTEVALDTGLSEVDDLDLVVTSAGALLLAVRDGDSVRWMALAL